MSTSIKDVEKRLAEYRRQTANTTTKSEAKFPELVDSDESECSSSELNIADIVDERKISWPTSLVSHITKPIATCYHLWPKTSLIVSLIIWFITQLFFAYIEFGSVFFILSLFLFIIANLGSRRAGEPSAYSVFNPNCERLPGTLTAEHFENQLLMRNRVIT